MKILVTGGCGFIGSNFVRLALAGGIADRLVNLDLLTYAGNPENLEGVDRDARYAFVRADIADRAAVVGILREGGFDAVVNFAAESHVDRSIMDSGPFVRTNVLGTQVLLDCARQAGVGRFIQVSTDEVYGSLGPAGRFTESTPLAPNSPYSASKADADLLARSYHETFGFPVIVTRASNNYGPFQFPEKLIPLAITELIEDRPVPVYGDGMNVRDWLHVEDHAAAIAAVLRAGRPGEVYNIGGGNERPNIEIVRKLLAALGKPDSLIRFVLDRPGHDRRYAIDSDKAQRELGWRPRRSFEDGIEETVRWYLDNRRWWERVKSGAYREYFEKWYGREGRARG